MSPAELVAPGKLPGLFLSRRFEDTARQLVYAALAEGFEWVDPTPLVDPFWHTTFTPSSSEIIFRLIERCAANGTPLPDKAVTLQPCIRALDLAPWSDGRHLLHFHMVTYFWFEPVDLVGPLRWSLDAMRAAKAPVDTGLYSYFQPPSPVVPEPRHAGRFGASLLDQLGVGKDRQIPARGSSNYHLNDHRDETGAGYEAWGPRIELFADQSRLNAAPLEFATLVLEGCRTPKVPDHEYLITAAAIGVERLTMTAEAAPSYWRLPGLDVVVEDVASIWGLEPPTEVIVSEVRHAIEILLGLAAIASTVPDLKPSYKGVAHQLRRLVTGLSKKLHSLGVPKEGVKLCLQIQGAPWNKQDLDRIYSWLP